MTRLTYDVYKGSELIGKEIGFHELLNLFNLTSSTLATYIKNRTEDKIEIREYTVIVNKYFKPGSEFTLDFIRRWDEMTIAAELIRTGQGKIETRLIKGKYRKVTVPK